MWRRTNRKPRYGDVDLAGALDDIDGLLVDFLAGLIDSDELWPPFQDWFANEHAWDRETDRRLEEFFFVVESCVPRGFEPRRDLQEIDEAELRMRMRMLLVEAGNDPASLPSGPSQR